MSFSSLPAYVVIQTRQSHLPRKPEHSSPLRLHSLRPTVPGCSLCSQVQLLCATARRAVPYGPGLWVPVTNKLLSISYAQWQMTCRATPITLRHKPLPHRWGELGDNSNNIYMNTEIFSVWKPIRGDPSYRLPESPLAQDKHRLVPAAPPQASTSRLCPLTHCSARRRGAHNSAQALGATRGLATETRTPGLQR